MSRYDELKKEIEGLRGGERATLTIGRTEYTATKRSLLQILEANRAKIVLERVEQKVYVRGTTPPPEKKYLEPIVKTLDEEEAKPVPVETKLTVKEKARLLEAEFRRTARPLTTVERIEKKKRGDIAKYRERYVEEDERVSLAAGVSTVLEKGREPILGKGPSELTLVKERTVFERGRFMPPVIKREITTPTGEFYAMSIEPEIFRTTDKEMQYYYPKVTPVELLPKTDYGMVAAESFALSAASAFIGVPPMSPETFVLTPAEQAEKITATFAQIIRRPGVAAVALGAGLLGGLSGARFRMVARTPKRVGVKIIEIKKPVTFTYDKSIGAETILEVRGMIGDVSKAQAVYSVKGHKGFIFPETVAFRAGLKGVTTTTELTRDAFVQSAHFEGFVEAGGKFYKLKLQEGFSFIETGMVAGKPAAAFFTKQQLKWTGAELRTELVTSGKTFKLTQYKAQVSPKYIDPRLASVFTRGEIYEFPKPDYKAAFVAPDVISKGVAGARAMTVVKPTVAIAKVMPAVSKTLTDAVKTSVKMRPDMSKVSAGVGAAAGLTKTMQKLRTRTQVIKTTVSFPEVLNMQASLVKSVAKTRQQARQLSRSSRTIQKQAFVSLSRSRVMLSLKPLSAQVAMPLSRTQLVSQTLVKQAMETKSLTRQALIARISPVPVVVPTMGFPPPPMMSFRFDMPSIRGPKREAFKMPRMPRMTYSWAPSLTAVLTGVRGFQMKGFLPGGRFTGFEFRGLPFPEQLKPKRRRKKKR